MEVQIFHPAGQKAVNFDHGNRPIQRRMGNGHRISDGRHLGGAGGDEETTDFFGIHPVFLAKFAPRHHSSHFHGLPDVRNMGDQLRETYPDQPNDHRAGRRNHWVPIRRQAAHIFPKGTCHDVRSRSYLVHVVKANAQKPLQNLFPADLPLELTVQRRRGKRDFVFELFNDGKWVGLGVFGVMVAYADAFAAVDAAFVDDMRPTAAHPDGLGGTALQAVGASHAFFPIQANRMKLTLVHGRVLFHFVRSNQAIRKPI